MIIATPLIFSSFSLSERVDLQLVSEPPSPPPQKK